MTAVPPPPPQGTYLRGRDGSIWARYTIQDLFYRPNTGSSGLTWEQVFRNCAPLTVLIPSRVIGGEE